MMRAPLSALTIAAWTAVAPAVALAETIVTSPFRGVTHYTRTEPPGVVAPRRVVMNIVQIDLADPAVSFFATPGNGAAPGEFTGQRTSQFVSQYDLQIGINADFFSSAGTGPNGEIYRNVTNLAASNGSLISPWPDNPGTIRGALNVSANNVPTLVRPPSGSGGTFNTTPTVTLYNAVGGSDRMINNGNVILSSAFANEVHPRTVVGYNATHLFLFTVDGRQSGYSEGMNLYEIANVLKNDYGVTHALNLDGGGSTTLVMADPLLRVVNRPSDGSERVNGNNFGVYAAQWPQWGVDSSGNWSVASNWIGGVPNGVGQVARFRNAITANRTVTLDSAATVGSMVFEGAKTYTIGGTRQLTLDAAAGANASIHVNTTAPQVISVSLRLNDATDVNVAASANLTIAATLNNTSGVAINKNGAGTLTLSGPQVHSIGAAMNVNAGSLALLSNAGSAGSANLTLNANAGTTTIQSSQNLHALNIGAAGVATITQGGPKTVKTKSLTIAAGGKLNVTDNDVVIDYAAGTASPIGTASGGTYSGVTGMIQSGRAGGAWNGPGIQSSRAAVTGGLTAVGVAEASDVLHLSGTQTALWSGQTVDASSVLVMYTYGGDANLDGIVSGDDYTAIDFHIQVPGASGWYNGDFNYDGVVSGDDYTTIDFSILAQGPSLAASPSGTLTPVPEPAAAAGAVVLMLAGVRCRRHQRRPPPGGSC